MEDAVQPADFGREGGQQGRRRLGVFDGCGRALVAFALKARHRRLQARLVAGDPDYPSAVGRNHRRRRLAKARGGAGDQDGAILHGVGREDHAVMISAQASGCRSISAEPQE